MQSSLRHESAVSSIFVFIKEIKSEYFIGMCFPYLYKTLEGISIESLNVIKKPSAPTLQDLKRVEFFFILLRSGESGSLSSSTILVLPSAKKHKSSLFSKAAHSVMFWRVLFWTKFGSLSIFFDE